MSLRSQNHWSEAFDYYYDIRHVLKPGTLEHQNNRIPQYSRTPEKPEAPNLTVLFCFSITDHKKIQFQHNLFLHVTQTSLEAGARSIEKKEKGQKERRIKKERNE